MSEETEHEPSNNCPAEDYRVALDIYDGPLDLLLYLVYRSEVDIFDIPISEILEQYLGYVEFIKTLDLEIAGDFMVMASRLMNIKSKMLMPRPEVEPEEDEIIDPRTELVKELLEYKEYKERAYALEQKRLERTNMYERVPSETEEPAKTEECPDSINDEVSVWDLLVAFHKITKDFMPDQPRKIVYDDTPITVYVERLLTQLSSAPEKRLAFSTLFEQVEHRMQVIGLFLGVLEAAKQGAIELHQVQDRGEIYLEYVPEGKREKVGEPEVQDREKSD